MNDHKRQTPSMTLHSLTASARRVGILSVLMLLVVSSGCDSSETSPSSNQDATSADVLPDIQEPPADLLAPSQIANFEEAIEEGHPAIIVAVVDGEYSQIYSFGELESGETPDGQTLFEIGHATTTFSSLLLADAVVAGDVTLEQPVQQLLPDFEIPTRNGLEITLGHLATEFSGLPNDPTDLQPYDFANPYVDYDLAKLKSFLADYELERDPGSEHWSSRVGYAILGQALGQKASSDYATLLKSKIFEPLGMSASVLDVRDADGTKLAKGHTYQGFETPNWDVNVFAPSVGIVSNSDDMLRYLQAHMGHIDTPLYPAMQLTHQAHKRAGVQQVYGLGWELFPLENREMLWQEGGTQGYASFIGLRADGSRGVVILTNISKSLLSLGVSVLMVRPEDEVAQDDEPDVTEEEEPDASPDVEEDSDELMSAELLSQYERAIEMQGYPAIIAAVVDGDRAKVYSFGYLDSGVEPDGETLFEIGFITKTFTALLLADAVEAGDVTLEQPLQELLPDFNIPTRNGLEITLEHVATQRSGLPIQPTNFYPPDRSNPYAHYDLAMLKSFLSDYTLRDDPGAVYQHSVVDYGTLGYALGEKAGSDYATLLESRIFEPLGMSSSLSDVSQADASRLAIGHKNGSGQVVANWTFDIFTPAGAIVSSGHDMLRYLKANMGQLETPLYPAMQLAHQVHAPGPHINARSGLGWMTGPSDSGDIIEHSSVTGGYSAYIGFLADGSRGVVVLTNIASGANHLGKITLTD